MGRREGALSALPRRFCAASGGDYYSKPHQESVSEAVYEIMHEADPGALRFLSLGRLPDWEMSQPVTRLLYDHNRSCLKLILTLLYEVEQPGCHRSRGLVLKAEDDDAGEEMSSRREEITKVEIEREYDSLLVPGQFQNLVVRKALKSLLPKVENVMAAPT